MAIRIEFFNNIYNVKNVEARYPGGYEGFKKDFPLSIRVWYDGCLIRFGDMAFPCGGELGNDFLDCIVNAGPYTENIEELLPEKYYLSGHLMWTEKMPEEPIPCDNGEYYQGGFMYKTHDVWAKANLQLVRNNNVKPFRYFEYKGLITNGWYNGF